MLSDILSCDAEERSITQGLGCVPTAHHMTALTAGFTEVHPPRKPWLGGGIRFCFINVMKSRQPAELIMTHVRRPTQCASLLSSSLYAQ